MHNALPTGSNHERSNRLLGERTCIRGLGDQVHRCTGGHDPATTAMGEAHDRAQQLRAPLLVQHWRGSRAGGTFGDRRALAGCM